MSNDTHVTPITHIPEYDVFLSYRATDFELAERIFHKLKSHGLRVWFDSVRLQPGCNWHHEIEAGCEASRIVLPVLTPRWQQSEWTRYETYGAEQIIPLLWEGEFEQVAPLPLHERQFIDFRKPDESTWEQLILRINEYRSEPKSVKMARLHALAIPANPFFVGREQALLELHEGLFRKPTTVLTQGAVQAVSGLGGIGKTTLARQYAEKFWRLFDDIVWVRAEQPIVLEFQRLAVELGLIRHPSTDPEADAQMALHELSGQKRRLLVFDNAPNEETIHKWFPKAGGCRTIVTSRFSGWSAAVQNVSIPVLMPEAACELLIRRANITDTDQNRLEAGELAAVLGFLPLALEQSAAFVKEGRISFRRYLEYYQATESRRDLLAQKVLGSTHYPQSLAATWITTVERLAPLSQSLLKFISFLAPDDIPRHVIPHAYERPQREANSEKDVASEESLSPSSLAIDQSLAELTRYSMITLTADSILVHRLVQTIQRDWLSEVDKLTWTNTATSVLSRIFPEPLFEHWGQCMPLLPHAVASVEYTIGMKKTSADALRLANKVARHLTEKGEPMRASVLLSSLLDLEEEETSLSALALMELGYAYSKSDLHSKSVEILSKAFSLLESSPLRNTKDLAESMVLLGASLFTHFKHAEAEPLIEKALAMRIDLHGETHRDVADAMNTLAICHSQQGALGKAEQLFRRALKIWEEVLDPNHPDIAACLGNLGVTLGNMGRRKEAETLQRRSMELDKSLLGVDHPNIATAATSLGVTLEELRRYDEAVELHEEALAIARTRLGDLHPRVAVVLNNFGAALVRLEQYEKAEQRLREALHIHEVTHSSDGGGVGNVLNNLSHCFSQCNNLEEAENYARRAISAWKEAFGEKHHFVAVGVDNLAAYLLAQGKFAESEAEYRRLINIEEQIDPPNYTNIVSALLRLAQVCVLQSKNESAEETYNLALRITEAECGANDDFQATVLNYYARFLQSNGRHPEAIPILRKAIGIAERSSEKGEEQASTYLNNLAVSLISLEDSSLLDEAENCLIRAIAANESFANPHYWLAQVFQRRNNRVGELCEWRRYLELGANDESRNEEAVARIGELSNVVGNEN